ncbi:MAG: hypothetical protein ABRQ25_12025 [Clostridiaceae bacterium]
MHHICLLKSHRVRCGDREEIASYQRLQRMFKQYREGRHLLKNTISANWIMPQQTIHWQEGLFVAIVAAEL